MYFHISILLYKIIFFFFEIKSQKKNGKKNNKKLNKNPNKKDNRNSYIVIAIKSDNKKKFSKKEKKNLKLDSKDEEEILDIIKRNKHFN